MSGNSWLLAILVVSFPHSLTLLQMAHAWRYCRLDSLSLYLVSPNQAFISSSSLIPIVIRIWDEYVFSLCVCRETDSRFFAILAFGIRAWAATFVFLLTWLLIPRRQVSSRNIRKNSRNCGLWSHQPKRSFRCLHPFCSGFSTLVWVPLWLPTVSSRFLFACYFCEAGRDTNGLNSWHHSRI